MIPAEFNLAKVLLRRHKTTIFQKTLMALGDGPLGNALSVHEYGPVLGSQHPTAVQC